MPKREDNGNIAYSMLSKAFENDSAETSCQTLYEAIIKVILVSQLCQNDIINTQGTCSDRTTSQMSNNNSDFQLQHNMAHHIEIITSLCLKSIVRKHCNHTFGLATKVLMEKDDFDLIEAFTRHLVHCLIFMCKESTDDFSQRESCLQNALKSSHVVLDFIVGLSSIVRAKQAENLVSLYFEILRNHEIISLQKLTNTDTPAQSEEFYYQMKCSQQLRILAAETLSSMPSFMALNVPMKYVVTDKPDVRKEATAWLKHHVGRIQVALPGFDKSNAPVKSGWLSELMIVECLNICSAVCLFIVKESVALLEAVRSDNKNNLAFKLSKVELESFYCTAFHAVSIVYELVVRRHSMDLRFQSESAQGRIAGLIATTILNQTCENVQLLAELDCTNEVRSTWLLCFIYVVQEAPESLVYDFIRSCLEKVSTDAIVSIQRNESRCLTNTITCLLIGYSRKRVYRSVETLLLNIPTFQ
jgi:hypothetical protein